MLIAVSSKTNKDSLIKYINNNCDFATELNVLNVQDKCNCGLEEVFVCKIKNKDKFYITFLDETETKTLKRRMPGHVFSVFIESSEKKKMRRSKYKGVFECFNYDCIIAGDANIILAQELENFIIAKKYEQSMKGIRKTC